VYSIYPYGINQSFLLFNRMLYAESGQLSRIDGGRFETLTYFKRLITAPAIGRETRHTFVSSVFRHRRTIRFYYMNISEVKGLRERRRDASSATDEASKFAYRITVATKLSALECLKIADRLFGVILLEDLAL
jgi:hypothetical protein